MYSLDITTQFLQKDNVRRSYVENDLMISSNAIARLFVILTALNHSINVAFVHFFHLGAPSVVCQLKRPFFALGSLKRSELCKLFSSTGKKIFFVLLQSKVQKSRTDSSHLSLLRTFVRRFNSEVSERWLTFALWKSKVEATVILLCQVKAIFLWRAKKITHLRGNSKQKLVRATK